MPGTDRKIFPETAPNKKGEEKGKATAALISRNTDIHLPLQEVFLPPSGTQLAKVSRKA